VDDANQPEWESWEGEVRVPPAGAGAYTVTVTPVTPGEKITYVQASVCN
jgi:hypothetical protein